MKKIRNMNSNRATRKVLYRAMLPALIASTLACASLQAQDKECEELKGTPPGLYATTDEGRTFMIKDGKTIELAPGEAGYAGEGKLTCIKSVPEFLDWPCSSEAAQSRKFKTYPFSDLDPSSGNLIKQVTERYFEVPEVIEPIPEWLEGESSAALDFDQIVPYSSPEYWYLTNPAVDIMNEIRPKILLISLYVGINLVTIDNHTVDALRKFYGSKAIPVVFLFNDSNAVPVSYFGANVSLEEIHKAFNERKIKLAEVPLWRLGDYHFAITAEEFDKNFKLPSLDEVDEYRREALAAELETFGFTRKPVFVTLLEGGKMYIDDPDRVRVALSLGITRLNSVINFVESDSHLNRCGPGTPVGSGGVSGATTPIGGGVVPGGTTPPPPDPEPNPSDS